MQTLLLEPCSECSAAPSSVDFAVLRFLNGSTDIDGVTTDMWDAWTKLYPEPRAGDL